MEHYRDLEQEEMLGDIIHDGGDDITSQFLNDSDGEGREDDGSGDRTEGGWSLNCCKVRRGIYIN